MGFLLLLPPPPPRLKLKWEIPNLILNIRIYQHDLILAGRVGNHLISSSWSEAARSCYNPNPIISEIRSWQAIFCLTRRLRSQQIARSLPGLIHRPSSSAHTSQDGDYRASVGSGSRSIQSPRPSPSPGLPLRRILCRINNNHH